MQYDIVLSNSPLPSDVSNIWSEVRLILSVSIMVPPHTPPQSGPEMTRSSFKTKKGYKDIKSMLKKLFQTYCGKTFAKIIRKKK